MRRAALWLVPMALATAAACGPTPPDTLYVKLGCPRCHGTHRQGNQYGPPLRDLASHWDSADEIVRYFRDPEAVIANRPRLQEARARYGLRMPPVQGRSDEEIQAFAQWLLVGPAH